MQLVRLLHNRSTPTYFKQCSIPVHILKTMYYMLWICLPSSTFWRHSPAFHCLLLMKSQTDLLKHDSCLLCFPTFSHAGDWRRDQFCIYFHQEKKGNRKRRMVSLTFNRPVLIRQLQTCLRWRLSITAGFQCPKSYHAKLGHQTHQPIHRLPLFSQQYLLTQTVAGPTMNISFWRASCNIVHSVRQPNVVFTYVPRPP